MIVSIETPVFKGRRLRRLIDSVLNQSSPHWTFSLLWDGGDAESRRILEELDRERHPNVTVYFAENRGIARARRFLSEHTVGDFILPVDDDDVLPFHAIERFLIAAEQKPWASIIRARRIIIDDDGKVLQTPPWFPFEPRHYQQGMVTDLFNHTHPYLIRRSAYERTSGWEGFEDFRYAGEDCDIYVKLEETGSIELLDETLYYYRVHNYRASLVLTDAAAFEMWRRLADKTIKRIGLPLRRTSDRQPFVYERLPRPPVGLTTVDFIVVRDERSMQAEAERIAVSLRDAGVHAERVRIVSGSLADVNKALRGATQPMLCLLSNGVAIDRPALEALLDHMKNEDADVGSPRVLDEDGRVAPTELLSGLVLIRSEVIRAVGGLDEGFEELPAAVVDLGLKARQRDFRIAYFDDLAPLTRRSAPAIPSLDVDRLRRKWATYPELLAHVAAVEATDVIAAR